MEKHNAIRYAQDPRLPRLSCCLEPYCAAVRLEPRSKQSGRQPGSLPLVLTVLTNHELGVLKVVPFWFHLNVDRVVGVVFVAAPFRAWVERA